MSASVRACAMTLPRNVSRPPDKDQAKDETQAFLLGLGVCIRGGR